MAKNPFGMVMPGMNFNSGDYRFGFNGKEKDDEVYNASGTSYDFGARIYSSRLGRWNSVDSLAHDARQVDKSPYVSMWNNSVIYKDPDGKIPLPVITGHIGLGAGAAKEIGGQMASNMLRGDDMKTAFKKVDWFDVGVSSVEGAVLGATGAGYLGNIVSGFATASIKATVDRSEGNWQYVGGDGRKNKDLKKVGTDFGAGMLGNSWGKVGWAFKSNVVRNGVETTVNTLVDAGMRAAVESGNSNIPSQSVNMRLAPARLVLGVRGNRPFCPEPSARYGLVCCYMNLKMCCYCPVKGLDDAEILSPLKS